MVKRYNWGIVGLGNIGHQMAKAFPKSQTLYGCAAYHNDDAQEFASQFNISHAYSSYEDMLADSAIDIVYVGTITNAHYDCIKKALLAGKNVIAEKAITLSSKELEECVSIAKDKGLVVMEAQTIYHMPIFDTALTFAKE